MLSPTGHEPHGLSLYQRHRSPVERAYLEHVQAEFLRQALIEFEAVERGFIDVGEELIGRSAANRFNSPFNVGEYHVRVDPPALNVC